MLILLYLKQFKKEDLMLKIGNKKIKGRTFTFGELYTGRIGGWPCEAMVRENKQCRKLSARIQLSPKETKRLNKALPHTLINGDDEARGPEAANFILKNNLGKVVCDKHIEFVD